MLAEYFPDQKNDGPKLAGAPGVQPWDYHLVIKGYKNSAQTNSIRNAVGLFLEQVFGADRHCPLQYGYHCPAGLTGNLENRVLQVSFTTIADTSMTLNGALSAFCDKFFQQEDATAPSTLSRFGILGFSPGETRFKMYWYEALFKWMHGYRMDNLRDLDNKISQMRQASKHSCATWMPAWQGAALLSISIGTTLLCRWSSSTVSQGLEDIKRARDLQKNMSTLVNVADIVLKKIATAKEDESNPDQIVKDTKDSCTALTQSIDRVVTQINRDVINNPPINRPRMEVHLEINQGLIDIFENGFHTVTSCKKAVEYFIKARSEYVSSALASTSRTILGVQNVLSTTSQISQVRNLPIEVPVNDKWYDQAKKFLKIIDQTPGEITAAAEAELIRNDYNKMIRGLQVEGLMSAAQVAVSAYQIVSAARSAYGSHVEAKKWTGVAKITNVGVRYAQLCELYIRWTYNSGDSPYQLSREQLDQLAEQCGNMNIRVPTPEELNPETIRAVLGQYGVMLGDMGRDLQGCL